MKIKTALVLLVISLFAIWCGTAFGQDYKLSEIIIPPISPDNPEYETQVNENLDTAVDPLLDFLGFYTGGGLYHTAKTHGLGGFDVGLRVVTMMVSDDQKPILPNADPNIPGAYGGLFKDFNLYALPLLQVSIGLPGNLDAMARFFSAEVGGGDAKGRYTLIGLGAKYGLIQNIALPRVSLIGMYHYLDTDANFDFGKVHSINAAAIISKGILFFDIYGGLGFDYNTIEVNLELPGLGPVVKKYNKSNFRGDVGVKIKPIPLLFIHVDYSFGKVQGFNVGLGLNFL